MEREYKTVIYTKEDLQGFYFSDVPEQEKDKFVKRVLNELYVKIKISCILLIPSIIVKLTIDNFEFTYFTALYDIIIIFILICHIYLVVKQKKELKKGIMKSYKIVILEKLPIESEMNYPENGIHKYYPVLGKDTVTGYESKCYISKEQYDMNEKEQVLEIWKLFKQK